MNLGRGFRYFIEIRSKFPDTNLDLYSPRRISTTEVTEFFLDRAWRDRVSPPSCSESRQNDVVSVKEEEQEEVEEDDDNEADFIALEEQHSPAGAGAESSRASAVNSPAVMAEEEGKQEMTEETGSQSQEEGCQAEEELELETDFFGLNDTKKEDNVQALIAGSSSKVEKLGPKTHYKPQRTTKDKSVLGFMTCSKALGALGLISVRGLDHPLTGNSFLCSKTTKLIHELEDRRDSYVRLQEEGEKAAATFVSFEDLQNLEQVQKWTSSKVREDLCQVHEAYQYFRHKYKDKTMMINPQNTIPEEKGPDQKEDETVVYEKLTLGVQHRGRITNKEATKILRQFWPRTIIKSVEVKRRKEVGAHPGYQPLWLVLRLAPGYTFENYLDWPEYEDNWPLGFDKGLFKEED